MFLPANPQLALLRWVNQLTRLVMLNVITIGVPDPTLATVDEALKALINDSVSS